MNETIPLEIGRTRTRVLRFIKCDPKRMKLEEADLIVAGGKGIGKEILIVEELAGVLGASIGGTRPLVDEGIIPFERQIGITGKSVTPRMLTACGISGAREFTMGVERTPLTIAINTDAKAPIFRFANLGIIGDLHKIIPPLLMSSKDTNRILKKVKSDKLVSAEGRVS